MSDDPKNLDKATRILFGEKESVKRPYNYRQEIRLTPTGQTFFAPDLHTRRRTENAVKQAAEIERAATAKAPPRAPNQLKMEFNRRAKYNRKSKGRDDDLEL